MATAGETYFYLGGRDVECTPTQPSSPITWSTQHGERSINMRSVPFPFAMPDWCTGDMLRHAVCAVNTVPFIYLGEREVQHPQSFRILGIVHALYIKYATHNTTLFYISIASNKKYKALHLFTLI